MATTTKNNTSPKQAAAIAMLKAGHVSLSEVAILAGVSRQLVFRWLTVREDGQRVTKLDWQQRRWTYLEKQWRKHIAKFSVDSA